MNKRRQPAIFNHCAIGKELGDIQHYCTSCIHNRIFFFFFFAEIIILVVPVISRSKIGCEMF